MARFGPQLAHTTWISNCGASKPANRFALSRAIRQRIMVRWSRPMVRSPPFPPKEDEPCFSTITRKLLLNSLPKNDAGFLCMAWSPNSRWLFLGRGGQRDGCIYDAKSARFYDAVYGGINPTSTNWSHDSKLLAVAGKGAVALLNPETGKLLDSFRDKEFNGTVALSPKGNLIGVGHENGIRVYDIAKKAWIKTEDGPAAARDIGSSPDGKRIVGGFNNHAVWDFESGKILFWLERGLSSTNIPAALFLWSADGKTISGIDRYANICSWDAATGKLLRKEKNGTDYPPGRKLHFRFVPLINDQFLAISPEGHYAAARPRPSVRSSASCERTKARKR